MLRTLLPVVHRFTMNAYDYTQPGPHAPYDWIESTLQHFTAEERSKVLMGLPFYGYDNKDALIGSNYIASLQEHGVAKLRWDTTAHVSTQQFTLFIKYINLGYRNAIIATLSMEKNIMFIILFFKID